MKPHGIVVAGLVALVCVPAAFGADADPLAAGAALEADAMAAISGAQPGADVGAPTLAGLALPVASPAGGAATSVQAIGSGNAVASAVLLQTLPGPAAP